MTKTPLIRYGVKKQHPGKVAGEEAVSGFEKVSELVKYPELGDFMRPSSSPMLDRSDRGS